MTLFARRVRRPLQLLIGLFFYGWAIALIVQSGLGNAPWDVLAQGVTVRTGLSFGMAQNLIGLVVLLAWIPLRQRPGIGTVLNVLIIGPSAQFGLAVIPPANGLVWKGAYFLAGLVLLAVATGLYVGAKLGPGPRDGLMTGAHARFGLPIWVVRSSIEVAVVILGWSLGGNLGVGTVVFSLLIGPLCQVTVPFFAYRGPGVSLPSTQVEAGPLVTDVVLVD